MKLLSISSLLFLSSGIASCQPQHTWDKDIYRYYDDTKVGINIEDTSKYIPSSAMHKWACEPYPTYEYIMDYVVKVELDLKACQAQSEK